MVRYAALFGLSVFFRQVARGAEYIETGPVFGIVPFLAGMLLTTSPRFNVSGVPVQFSEMQGYDTAVLLGPPSDIESLGNG